MNRFILILFFLASCLILNAQQTASDMGLKGNVRRLHTYKHLADSLEIKNKTDVSYRKLALLEHIDYIFERNGLLLAENRFDNKRDLVEISYIYTFDENDRLIEVTRARMGRFLVGRTEYKYDEQGRKTRGFVYNHQDSLKNTHRYNYDSLGNLISEQVLNIRSLKVKDLVYHYDENGNCILAMSLPTRVSSNKLYREVQKFDERNNRIYKSYTESDSLRWEYFAQYNANDSLFFEEVKDGNGERTIRSELRYNKNNDRIFLRQYNKDLKIFDVETHYKYAKGKLQSEKVYTHKKKQLITTKTYFYDAVGNWIFCVEKDEKTGSIIVHSRRISYF